MVLHPKFEHFWKTIDTSKEDTEKRGKEGETEREREREREREKGRGGGGGKGSSEKRTCQ